jgi:hypothetical protein
MGGHARHRSASPAPRRYDFNERRKVGLANDWIQQRDRLPDSEHDIMRARQSSFHALRGVACAALILTAIALGSLRDALVYAPNGAEVDDPGTTATLPKR